MHSVSPNHLHLTFLGNSPSESGQATSAHQSSYGRLLRGRAIIDLSPAGPPRVLPNPGRAARAFSSRAGRTRCSIYDKIDEKHVRVTSARIARTFEDIAKAKDHIRLPTGRSRRTAF
ncbi:hypothetical protein EVAR_23157_1 [Eumeta japonica]|uniref:Uncharacterized protein n=1 Tax=Eumeta variegata TaxID=151549 RepID=A0A4C1VA35_EUMVA|nr:hypothetical protein EVAR_23157_1 [Eumeta japonica]